MPLTDKTRNILSAEAIAKLKPGVRIVNCARGGLVDEAALAEARARLANAETEFERGEKMIANNTIAQSRFDQLKAERDSARARLRAAVAGVVSVCPPCASDCTREHSKSAAP